MIDGEQRRRFARRDGGGWRELGASEAMNTEEGPGRPASTGWRLRVDQQLNQLADVVAVGTTGQVVRMTHLNPQYSPDDWGAMRSFAWTDTSALPIDRLGPLMSWVSSSPRPMRKFGWFMLQPFWRRLASRFPLDRPRTCGSCPG
jgi:hypothetical protein